MQSMLRLAPVSPQRRHDFHSGSLVDVDSDPVLSRWRRALALGHRDDGAASPDGVSGLSVVDRRSGLARAIDHVEPAALAGRPVMALLADKDGVVVWSHAGGFGDRAVQSRLVDGACWSERTRGTNAIGTALVEGRDIAVIGGAHSEDVNGGLFCYATPLIDPFGDVVGVLDVTGALADDDPAFAPVVQRLGRALREALRVEAWAFAGGALVVERMLDRLAVPALLIERDGVRRMNDRARAVFGDGAGVFGGSFVDLAAMATAGTTTEVRGHRLQLEPVLGQGGRVLSVVACLDPIARKPIARSSPFDAIAGDDPAVVRARALAARFAPTTIPVLLLAETGTGKELMARAIHQASARSDGPFVAINCGSLSPQLLESELFGFAAGSFTGARTGGSDGKIAAAGGGTLFLDELGEMSPALQAMLLRVLEDGSYSRVGENTVRKADFRLIGATCRDLPGMVASGAFRSDLFYRMHGASLTLPPLRDRGDRLVLARAILRGLADVEGVAEPVLADDAAVLIATADWPGNVRELKNALRHALLLCADGVVRAADFPTPLLAPTKTPAAAASTTSSLAPPKQQELQRALDEAGGNRALAARRLGVSRSTLYRWLDAVG